MKEEEKVDGRGGDKPMFEKREESRKSFLFGQITRSTFIKNLLKKRNKRKQQQKKEKKRKRNNNNKNKNKKQKTNPKQEYEAFHE